MKGMVALSGLEAMSNGIQFVINEDVALVKWGKKKLPKNWVMSSLIMAFIYMDFALSARTPDFFSN